MTVADAGAESAPAPAAPVTFSHRRETSWDGQIVRYLLRDDAGNHLGACPSERMAEMVTAALNFRSGAEAALAAIEPLLLALRDDIAAARAGSMPRTALTRADIRLDDIWKILAALRSVA